ncbi:phenylacetic acid degradation-related protein (plasmid) [Gemmatirosa kalamazoonensis]|uniref:Phenylacetic acid degradation-related protein n=1 Tax=Gemmatirosa kalamazoonensis TaxID=861299 RepID=W0RV02_9BACT|nr:PaaI family thioesterase [Gemmatirosa kalamazoonensis]AHG93413.1 phenylacetic acid degradation-related protein [Gemmatirosa kalamazoonensis]
MRDLTELQHRVAAGLPAYLGIRITHVAEGELHAELTLRPELMAVNGYLHAGTVVSLADTAAGFGCVAHLPDGADNFTTIELKSNHVGTARAGTVACVARLVHGGRTTQVWDATVSHVETGKVIAHYRATQLILYPRG